MILIIVSYKSILYCVLLYHTISPTIVSSQMEHGDAPKRCKWQVSRNLLSGILKMTTYTKINLITLALTMLAATLLKAAGILNGDVSFTFVMACIYAPMIIGCRYIALDIAR